MEKRRSKEERAARLREVSQRRFDEGLESPLRRPHSPKSRRELLSDLRWGAAMLAGVAVGTYLTIDNDTEQPSDATKEHYLPLID